MDVTFIIYADAQVALEIATMDKAHLVKEVLESSVDSCHALSSLIMIPCSNHCSNGAFHGASAIAFRKRPIVDRTVTAAGVLSV